MVWTLALSLGFGWVASYNLANYRPVSNDEGELLAVGYKLATRGILGSDLYSGFFGADQHFLITLPLQHVLEAVSFRLFGAGIVQARGVSVLAGVTTLWVVSWLAYRWYGLGAAMLCGLLLVAWPSDLTAAPNGLPLLGVTRAARYDVLALVFAWLAIALLDALLDEPLAGAAPKRQRRPLALVQTWRPPAPARVGLAFALGLCCGCATLAQFVGAFVLPVVTCTWLWVRGRRGLGDPALICMAAGLALVCLPWLSILIQNRADWTAQLTVYGSDRWDVLNPAFYLHNLLTEPSRYAHILPTGSSADPGAPNSPTSELLLVFGIWPAVAYLVWRARRSRASGDRLAWSSLVLLAGLLVLTDQTKTPLYAIILLPSVCLAIAALWTATWRWAAAHRQAGRGWPAFTTRALLLGVCLLVAVDGARAYQVYLAQATRASDYLGVGAQLETALRPDSRVLGPERWWWALHTHPYQSLRGIWWQWWAAWEAAPPAQPRLATWVTSARADSVLVNDNIRDDVRAFPEPLQRQFWAFLDACTMAVLDANDATYLRIEVHRIISPPPDLELCSGP